jgi:hypothetical protein
VRGIITSIKKDSFDLKFEKITYSMMRADTVHFSGFHYTISDIYVMPKKGLKIDYKNDKIQIITLGRPYALVLDKERLAVQDGCDWLYCLVCY